MVDEKARRAMMKLGREAFKAGSSEHQPEYYDALRGKDNVEQSRLAAAWGKGWHAAKAAANRKTGRTAGQSAYIGMLIRNGWI